MEQERDGEGKGVNEQAYVTVPAQLYKYWIYTRAQNPSTAVLHQRDSRHIWESDAVSSETRLCTARFIGEELKII